MLELFIDAYPHIVNGEIARLEQPRTYGSFHTRSELEPASHIDLDAPTTARNLFNQLETRTFPPHPGCRFSGRGRTWEATIRIQRLNTARDRKV